MVLIPIEVQSYSGYKSEEQPRRFFWRENAFEVAEILDRWYEGGEDPRMPVVNYFRVRTQEGKEYLLRHKPDKDLWYLVRHGETEASG